MVAHPSYSLEDAVSRGVDAEAVYGHIDLGPVDTLDPSVHQLEYDLFLVRHPSVPYALRLAHCAQVRQHALSVTLISSAYLDLLLQAHPPRASLSHKTSNTFAARKPYGCPRHGIVALCRASRHERGRFTERATTWRNCLIVRGLDL